MLEDENQNLNAGSDTPPEQTGSDNQSQPREFAIPDEYKNRNWTKFFDGKTGDELEKEFFKSYDSSQNLIGKKAEEYISTMDISTLSDEAKNKLSAQLTPQYSVPEDANQYDLNSILNDENGNQKFPTPPEAVDFFQNEFKEIGISKEQAQKIMKSFIDFQVGEFNKFTDPTELENNINAMFKGDTKKRNSCESLIREFLSPEEQQFVKDTLPNSVVEMFYKVSKGLLDKYDYKEGNAGSGSSTLQMSQAQKDAEYNRLTAEIEALNSRPHSAEEKARLMSQLLAVYK